MSDYIYGIVVDKIFYSNRMEFAVEGYENGIYAIDMSNDDFKSSLEFATIEDAKKFFSKSSKIKMIRGISFHDGIIPENPVKYSKLPLKVKDAVFDEFEEVEVVILKDKVCYFLQVVYGDKAYVLMDLKESFESNKINIDDIKGVTPEMRIVYAFLSMERKKQEMVEPSESIKNLIEESGGNIEFIKQNNRGFEVQWNLHGYSINSQLDKDYRVMEAGFCVSNWDKTQSARSLVNVLDDYYNDGLSPYITRTTK